jgi:hypothetical protein
MPFTRIPVRFHVSCANLRHSNVSSKPATAGFRGESKRASSPRLLVRHAVQFDLMQPLRPWRRLLDQLGKLRGDEERKGHVSAGATSFDRL